MFGISLTELLVVVIFAVILINPKEYPAIFNYLKSLYADFRRAYKAGLKELDKLKEEVGVNEMDAKLNQDIKDADAEIKKIVGDDGELYEAYDISDLMDKNEQKN